MDDDWSTTLGFARSTVTSDAVDVLGLKFAFPAYAAVSEFVPTGKFARVSTKRPLALKTPLPTTFTPFLIVTVPVVAAVTDLTLAVSLTDCP